MRVTPPPKLSADHFVRVVANHPTEALEVMQRARQSDEWMPWERFLRRPVAAGWTHEDAWALEVLRRAPLLQPVELLDAGGPPLRLAQPPLVLQLLHRIDQSLAGRFGALAAPTAADRTAIVWTALIDEALRSSEIEGAVSTRRDAEQMIRAGRRPRGRSEQMVLNNYLAMRQIRAWVDDDRPISLDALLELQALLVSDATDHEADAGRLRNESDSVVVAADATGEVVFAPPPAGSLPEYLGALVDFANRDPEHSPFLHPVLRAILCHYQLAWIHPFVDGNGRSARALWYWVMLRNRYAAAEFLSISHPIAEARPSYYRSFLHVQTDAHDTTYFVVSQLRFIERAIQNVERALQLRFEARAAAPAAIRTMPINERQRRVLEDALQSPGTPTTVRTHAEFFSVVAATARTDLRELVSLGLLQAHRDGRREIFVPVPDLAARLGNR